MAADSRAPRGGAFVEILGHYDPKTDPPTVVLDETKALRWLRNGARPSETVLSIFRKKGIIDKLTAEKKQ